MDFPNKRYSIIYADPCWSFKTYSDKGMDRAPEKHYSTMSLEDIYSLPVQSISADNCILFLWVTNPLLPEGIECARRWGFQYKTVGFTWIKQNRKAPTLFMGLGYWTRANMELCLIATKGSPKRVSAKVRQVVLSPIREHSRKPDEVRSRIVELCGDLPRIELFARTQAPGWDAWGNETDKFETEE